MMQAFDAPWPTIQANAIYFSSSMLSVSDDQHILALYYTRVMPGMQLPLMVKIIIFICNNKSLSLSP